MGYFTNCKTLAEIKARYKALALKFHPDKNPDATTAQRKEFETIMAGINNEYEAAQEWIKDPKKKRTEQAPPTEEDFKFDGPGWFSGWHFDFATIFTLIMGVVLIIAAIQDARRG